MAWIGVESSVARHPKFVKAGPSASWLWLCGLAYCQEGLTDGFIPREALEYLGVRGAIKLVPRLVEAQLWDQVDGGWAVHDYLAHNRSRNDVQTIRGERRQSGAKGGAASWGPDGGRRKHQHEVSAQADNTSQQTVVSCLSTSPSAVSPSTPVLSTPHLSTPTPLTRVVTAPCDVPLDEWFRELKASYPPQAVTSGARTEHAWCDVFTHDLRPAHVIWAEMQANLANQKLGHQWRVKRMIPKLETWLRDGLWQQQHDAHPPATLVSEKTARTLTSGAAFVAGGEQ